MKKLKQILLEFESEPAKFRLQILDFHDKYGTLATMDAYGVSKTTLYRWRKLYRDSLKDITMLVPKSRSPKHKRSMLVHYRVIDFIRSIRMKRGRIGKEKIKPLLDEFCLSDNLPTISISTIGKVIKRYKLFYSPSLRVYHNPNSLWAKRKVRFKDRVKQSPKIKSFGYLEIDTIVKFTYGIRLYIYNAIDVAMKFKFAYGYKSNSSVNASDFLKKLFEVYPIRNGINTIQTDNGSEFLGRFDEYLNKERIKHVFIYPRCPRINGCVERANRTLQEEFINNKMHLIDRSMGEFNSELMEYLIWYNTKRVHKSLNNITPIDYLLKTSPESHMYATHTKF